MTAQTAYRAAKEADSTDPRGPVRTIAAIDRPDGKAIITTDCGHAYERNPAFAYKVGASIRCFRCRATSKEGV